MRIVVNIAAQVLTVLDGLTKKQYFVSTAAKGSGEQKGSEQTPRGRHVIRAKIGEGVLPNMIFRARRPTGLLYQTGMADRWPNRDWILTRILWLSGRELGRNRLGTVDTMQRYIYIHGSPDETPMGKPGSRGCIRMHNNDLLELFDQVKIGCLVEIKEY